MKKLIVLMAIAVVSETMIAQADSAVGTAPAGNGAAAAKHIAIVPPQAVAAAFATRFPNTRVDKWWASKDTYVANFRQNRKKDFAYYAADGTWKATETPVKWTWRMPAAVRKGWHNSDFAAWYVLDIKKIETPDQTLYALHVSNWSLLDADHVYNFEDEYVLFFNEKGELVRKD